MKDFAFYLEKTKELGYVDQVFHAIISAHGLPHAHPGEVVMFETGEIGYVLGLEQQFVEVLLLSPKVVTVGTRVVRTGQNLRIRVTDDYLGKVMTSVEL